MSTPTPPLEEIVQQAAHLAPDAQDEFLKKVCGSDSDLYMQASHALHTRSSGGWWDDNIDSAAHAFATTQAAIVGTRIGPYQVVRMLGEGGMGEVVLAERVDEQFSQQVAIKLVRRGITSRQVLGRLKLERQILATLDHPNIAKLLDGGTSDGVPYIVMEYIDGVPIDQYCDHHKLGIEARLQLFRTVCSAVHYAHRNLVVHRDLKPSNILISAEGVPKLLDFGIAKILDERAFGHTLAVTHADYRLLTPDHASPEQLRGEPVTTASDTYVLGVLLYELLTGHKPYAAAAEARLSAIERAICELPPLPLDSLYHGRDDTPDRPALLAETAANRSTTLPRLKRHLTGDLSNIVLTALRKEPERRYPSVEHFSSDIDRYLHNMPVAARQDSVPYRVGKFLRRHAIGAAASALAICALIGFTVFTVFQAQRIDRERIKADRVASVLTDLFEQSDPSRSRGNEITVREVLDQGAGRIEAELRNQPETGASLLNTIGKVYTNLGEYERAITMLERSLATRLDLSGERNADVLESRKRLGEALMEKRDLAEAEKHLEQALRTSTELYGNQSPRTAAVQRRLARLRQMQERFDESKQSFEEALQIFDANPAASFDELTIALNDYAILLNYLGDIGGAQRMFTRALQLNQQRYGPDHPETAIAMLNLAVALEQENNFVAAEPYFTQALASFRKLFGAQSPQYVAALGTYGRLLRRSGQIERATSVLQEAVLLRRQALGDENYLVGYTRVNLAMALLDGGKPSEAERELRAALLIYERSLPRAHLYVASALRGLGLAMIDQQRPAEAERSLREAMVIQEQLVGAANPQVAATRAALGGALLEHGKHGEAESLLLDSYPVVHESNGALDTLTQRQRKWIERLFAETHRPGEATAYLQRVEQTAPQKRTPAPVR